MKRYEKWSHHSQHNDTNNSYMWSTLKFPKSLSFSSSALFWPFTPSDLSESQGPGQVQMKHQTLDIRACRASPGGGHVHVYNLPWRQHRYFVRDMHPLLFLCFQYQKRSTMSRLENWTARIYNAAYNWKGGGRIWLKVQFWLQFEQD